MLSTIGWVPVGSLASQPLQSELSPEEATQLLQHQQEQQQQSTATGATPTARIKRDKRSTHNDMSDSDSNTDDSDNEQQQQQQNSANTTQSNAASSESDDNASDSDASLKDETTTTAKSEDEADATTMHDADEEERTETQLMSELNMNDYDEEAEGAQLFLGGRNLTVHESNADDPYLTIADSDDDDASDIDDVQIKPQDHVLLVGRTEDEHSSLEVHIYDPTESSLYIHHDFVLPSFPLCHAFLACDPRTQLQRQQMQAAVAAASQDTDTAASQQQATSLLAAEERPAFIAVGTFQCGIELWNLNVLDVLEPTATLGGRLDVSEQQLLAAQQRNKLKKAKGKKLTAKQLKSALLGELKPGSHSDAVMCLDWHPAHPLRLVSGSADHTCKLWDLQRHECTQTLQHHSSKVQSLQFNPVEPSVLLSSAYDGTAQIVDVRTEHKSKSKLCVSTDSDCEQVRWSALRPQVFGLATESGQVTMFDARSLAKPLFTLAAHTAPCTALSFNTEFECFATASHDKTVKVWSMQQQSADSSSAAAVDSYRPSLVISKDMAVGALFSMSFCAGEPYLLACGGDKGKLAVWDLSTEKEMQQQFKQPKAVKPQ